MLEPSVGSQKHPMKNLDITNRIANSPNRLSLEASPEFRQNMNHNSNISTEFIRSKHSRQPSAWENRIHIKPLGSFRNIESENVFQSLNLLSMTRDPLQIREFHDKSRKRKYYCNKYRRIFPVNQKPGTVEKLKQENIDWVSKNQQSFYGSQPGISDNRHRVIHDNISQMT
jgi:hypothetical protein